MNLEFSLFNGLGRSVGNQTTRDQNHRKDTKENQFVNGGLFFLPLRKKMIQRLQTIFLFLAAVSCVLMFFFPIAYFFHETLGNYKFFITGMQCMDPDPRVRVSTWFVAPLFLAAGLSVILSVVSIFLYRNRPYQIRLVAFNILLNILLIVLIFLVYTGKIESFLQITPSYQAGVSFPLLSLLFLILANRWIRKDEALVRSADRLR
jgi:hypothetical protein